MARKLGRTPQHYRTSWGEVIEGLAQDRDGRFRIVGTTTRFTADERAAVERFRKLQGPPEYATVNTITIDRRSIEDASEAEFLASPAQFTYSRDMREPDKVTITRAIPADGVWNWLREQILADPKAAADRLGIPAIGRIRHDDLKGSGIKLQDLIDQYKQRNPSTARTKRNTLAMMNRLIRKTGATTLDDLSKSNLLDFKDMIEKEVPGPATRKLYYSQIKNVVAFGLKMGNDAEQITQALAKLKILWTAAPMPVVQPKPISREHFHQLLNATGEGQWRAWVLLALNCCLSIEECCGLKWEWFDLKKKTFCCIREKTRRHRIPRAAVLWNETLAELAKLPRKGPYVFVSLLGTRFSRNGRVNDFRDFRKAAKLPDTVTFGTLRDGAYTTAARADEKWARLLAGHASPGLQDSYVLRDPLIVAPACASVYEHYFPKAAKAKKPK